MMLVKLLIKSQLFSEKKHGGKVSIISYGSLGSTGASNCSIVIKNGLEAIKQIIGIVNTEAGFQFQPFSKIDIQKYVTQNFYVRALLRVFQFSIFNRVGRITAIQNRIYTSIT